jgi:hypothetical protein
MMLKLIIGAIIGLTILSFALTPADVVRQNKVAAPLELDLRNTNPSVFNSSAFSNQNPIHEHYNSTPKSDQQNDVGIPNSTLSFLNAEPNFGEQKIDKKIIHGTT